MLRLNLKHLRRSLSIQLNIDVGLADIARATGIHQNLYGRYEANKVSRPDLENMGKIYEFYRQRGLIVNGRLVVPGDLLTDDQQDRLWANRKAVASRFATA